MGLIPGLIPRLIPRLVDAVVVLFSVMLVVAVPLIDAQIVLPGSLFPAPLVGLKQWYGGYLMAETPHFFVGFVWVEIAFLWPLSVANIYGILGRRPWSATTSLMAGVSAATSMAALMAELMLSGKASTRLIRTYSLFLVFALFATLRGLLLHPRHGITATSHSPFYSRKRRV